MKAFRRGGALSLVAAVALLLGLVASGVTEEIVLGTVEGTVTMEENGRPLPGAYVTLSPIGMEEARDRSATADKDGRITIRNLPVGTYRVFVSARAHTLKSKFVAVEEAKPTSLNLALAPKPPELKLYSSQRVFTPYEQPEIEAHGFGPENELNISVYRLSVPKILESGSVRGLFYGLEYSRTDPVKPEEVGTLVSRSAHKIANRDAEGTFIDAVKLGALGEGFYYVRTDLGGVQAGTILNVSRIALVTKSVRGESLCFVTDIVSGKPISGAEIVKGSQALGSTGPDGTVRVKVEDGDRQTLLATHGESRAITDFYSWGGNPDAQIRMSAYTDRPIYRPGDEVHFKGFARKRVGSSYELPGAGQAKVEVQDESGELVTEFSVPTRPNGSFNGSFTTSKEAPPGQYQVHISAYGSDHVLPVNIAAYRKPEFTVQVVWDKARYTMGERAKATVRCNYYFGGPVVGAKVTAYVSRSPVWEWLREYEDEYGDYDSGGGEYLDSVELEGVTNADGEATLEFPTRMESDAEQLETDYHYTLVASVADEGDKYFDGEGRVLVTRGEFGLRTDVDSYVVNPGDQLEVTVQAFRHTDKAPLGGVPVKVTAGTEVWERNKSRFTPTLSQTVKTSADGTATIVVPVKDDGTTVIKALAEDSRGNRIASTAYAYVIGGRAGRGPEGKLTLTLDKALYKPGEDCVALISTSQPGGSALVTVESERVLFQKVVELDSPSTVVRIPVQLGYMPNVDVAVAAVRDKRFLEASQTLKTDMSERKLDISVTPDKPSYKPGETATYAIRATPADGTKPIPTELSVAVVDEAIYAIQSDSTDLLKDFYPRRYNAVNTSYSFPELYLDGGDKGGSIPVRSNFKDTAAWFPTVLTDENGNASVQVPLPDNLTQWRATVVGLSDATHAGLATRKITSSKPLMVRLQGPKFMVRGDKQSVAAIVTNHTSSDAQVHVVLEPSGFTAEGRLAQVIRVGKGASQAIHWPVTAVDTGDRKLVAKAWIEDGESDGVEQRIEVIPHGRTIVSGESGRLSGSGVLVAEVRSDADPNVGDLEISLSPTLASSLYGAVDSLIGFPYGCVEQTMSRFMPAVLLSQTPGAQEAMSPDLRAQLPDIVRDGLARLSKQQNSNGGWGWWEYDAADPFLTAYVLDGLYRAKQAGVDVSPFMLDRGLNWAAEYTAESKELPQQKRFNLGALRAQERDFAYLAFVLAQHGKTEEARRALKNVDLQKANAAALAAAALTHARLGDERASQRMLDRMIQQGEVSTNTAHWPESWGAWGAESTAWAQIALTELRPDDALVEKTVRYLMQARKGDGWYSTRDTSFVLIGTSQYLRHNPVGTEAIDVSVAVNGKPVGEYRLDPVSPKASTARLKLPIASLRPGRNEVSVRSSSGGPLYYTTTFKQVATAEELPAPKTSPGLKLSRSYHLLTVRKQEDGTMRLLPSKDPISRAKSGDLIRVLLTVESDSEREFMMLEDPLPSNCRVIERGDVDQYSWSWWWSQTVVRDDRVTLFSRFLEKGKNTFEYTMRAEAPGTSSALPPVIQNMYNPDEVATAGELRLEVRR